MNANVFCSTHSFCSLSLTFVNLQQRGLSPPQRPTAPSRIVRSHNNTFYWIGSSVSCHTTNLSLRDGYTLRTYTNVHYDNKWLKIQCSVFIIVDPTIIYGHGLNVRCSVCLIKYHAMKLYRKRGGTAPRIVNLETDETEACQKIIFVQLQSTFPRFNQRAHTCPQMVPVN